MHLFLGWLVRHFGIAAGIWLTSETLSSMPPEVGPGKHSSLLLFY